MAKLSEIKWPEGVKKIEKAKDEAGWKAVVEFPRHESRGGGVGRVYFLVDKKNDKQKRFTMEFYAGSKEADGFKNPKYGPSGTSSEMVLEIKNQMAAITRGRKGKGKTKAEVKADAHPSKKSAKKVAKKTSKKASSQEVGEVEVAA